MKKNKKILIVEDNELNLKLFSDLIKANHYDVIGVSDGHQAMEKIEENKPDMILMDIQLNGISGYKIIKDIRSDKKYNHLPILIVTAFAMPDDKKIIKELGCSAYITKPISIDSFLKTIKTYI